jgi:hypothetical protein
MYVGIVKCCFLCVGIGVERCPDVLAISVIQIMVVGVESCKTDCGRSKS